MSQGDGQYDMELLFFYNLIGWPLFNLSTKVRLRIYQKKKKEDFNVINGNGNLQSRIRLLRDFREN